MRCTECGCINHHPGCPSAPLADEPSIRIAVTGRGKLIAEAYPQGDGVVVRVDDKGNPEFWVQLALSAGQLRELLAMCE